jgi:polyisoprenoid-binding protein YceI
MSPKLLIPLFALAILLSACSTEVITEEDRELPAEGEQMDEVSFTGTLSEIPTESFIAFTGSKGAALSFEGKFNEFETAVEFAEGEPVSVSTTIQIKSMETDVQKLTDHLLNPDFFETETYEEATFTSSSVELMEGGLYFVTGDLTIKDVTLEENITFNITQNYIEGIHTIDRTLYNVGNAEDGVDLEVPLEFKVVLQ